ncbi:MAG: autotransporter-associated beta strand repeat-containing protein, partial [Prosthecobacter sp.]|nr:autotransporter-associated beta strand repeat-containing protein [Prosthecobacter sp.]
SRPPGSPPSCVRRRTTRCPASNRGHKYRVQPASTGGPSFTLGGGVQIAVVAGSITADGSSAITLTNPISLSALDQPGTTAAHNNISASGANTVFTLSGVISGQEFRKVGAGKLHLSGSNTHLVTEIRNGTLIADSTTALNGAQVAGHDLYFADKGNDRTLEVQANTVVTYLDGNSPDPDDAGDAGYPQQATAFINIPSGKTFTVDYTAEVDGMGEEIKPSFQGNIGGVSSTYGTFIKDGTGTQRFTIWPKTFAGAYVVNQGVLQVSKNGEITGATGGITVENGGQLRLSTGVDDIGDIADATYNFGGTLTLKSIQRDVVSPITYPSGGFGVLGGLRFDPDTGIQYGALASNVFISATSEIHVNGVDKVFFLSGNLTGSAALSQTGGGKLVLNGDATGYTGTFSINNGTTELPDDQEFGGSIVVNADKLVCEGDALIDGDLDVANAAVVTFDADVSSGILVVGDATLATGAVIDFQGTGTAGNTYLVIVAGSSISAGTISVINTPTTATVNNTGTELEITLAAP